MKTLQNGNSVDFYLNELVATHAAIDAHGAGFADLAEQTQKSIEHGDVLNLKLQKHERQNAAITGRVRYYQTQLAEGITNFALQLSLTTAKDREDPLYVRFFPKGVTPSSFNKQAALKQAETVMQVFIPALQELPENKADMKKHAPILQAAAEGLIRNLQARAAQVHAENATRADIYEWKEQVNTLRTDIHAKLFLRALENGKNRINAAAFSEGFFGNPYESSKSKASKVEKPEAPSTPTTPA